MLVFNIPDGTTEIYEGHPENKERLPVQSAGPTCFVAADHWFLMFSVMLKIAS